MKKGKFPMSRKGETSYRETAFGIIGRSKLIPLEIEGIKKAWNFVLQKNAKGRTAITSLFLQKVHRVGFGWIFPKMAGEFRRIEITVSEHTPPRFYLVPQLMKNFTDDLKIRLTHLPTLDHPNFFKALIDLLAWAHHRFLLKVETKVGRSQYIQALQKADNAHYEALKKLIKSSLEEAAKELA